MTDQTPMIGHNQPPIYDEAEYAALEKKALEFADAAGDWLTKFPDGIVADPDAEALADFIAGARAVYKQTEARRKAEKEPHLEAGRNVDSAFKSLTSKLEAAMKRVMPLQTAFLARKQAEEDARRKAEQERIAAEQAKLAQERAQAAARTDIAGEADAAEKAKELEKAAKAAAKPARAQVHSASGGGRTMSLRTNYRASIENARVCALHYQNAPELIETLERLANAELRASKGQAKIPGVSVHEVQGAA